MLTPKATVPLVTQAIPCTKKLGLEQHKAVIAWTTSGTIAFGVSNFNKSTNGIPVDYLINLKEKGLFNLTMTNY